MSSWLLNGLQLKTIIIMEEYPEDDVAAFFNWKSNIERNAVESRKTAEEQNKKEMTVKDLSRRLSVSTVVSDSNTARSRKQGEKPSDPRQRMPPNKEIELISKVSETICKWPKIMQFCVAK